MNNDDDRYAVEDMVRAIHVFGQAENLTLFTYGAILGVQYSLPESTEIHTEIVHSSQVHPDDADR